jgi:nitroreductase
MKKALFTFLALSFAVSNVFAADAIDTIMNRKSVRQFEREKISDKNLDIIVKAGFAAPSAIDRRPWSFIIVDDFSILDALADKLPYAKMLKEAGAAIIVCGKADKDLFWVMDCSAATENILLAVQALKLGAVWTAVFPDKARVDAVREILSIPNEYVPLNVIPIGKPKGAAKPKNKYDETKIHHNKW